MIEKRVFEGILMDFIGRYWYLAADDGKQFYFDQDLDHDDNMFNGLEGEYLRITVERLPVAPQPATPAEDPLRPKNCTWDLSADVCKRCGGALIDITNTDSGDVREHICSKCNAIIREGPES